MHQLLEDAVDVVVEFEQKKIRPRFIRWDGNIYKPNSVNLIHRSREGDRNIVYISVSDDVNFMKLRFDPVSLDWKLVEIYTD